MTSTIVFLVACLGADPNTSSTLTKEPAFHELQSQISQLLKREAAAKDALARADAVQDLCQLHQQIVADARYSTSDTLKEYRARVWSRLTKIKTELKQQLARDAKGNKDALAELATLEAADPAAVVAADSLAASLSLLDQGQGGPGYFLAFGGGAGPANNGRDLVALIERTINPAFWDVNGGPGAIVYYAPLQCLVVRATTEVHERIGGVVGDLRGADR